MHERRNFALILLLLGAIVWAVWAWLLAKQDPVQPLLMLQRIGSIVLLALLGGWLFYSMRIEDRLPDHLRQKVGPFYYEADGLSFLPMIRVHGKQAELCVYYQNRYENPVECLVHLRPPEPPNSFIIHEGFRDVHLAFKCSGGDFGAIHQPIAVPKHLQGEVIDVQMAASSWYPRSQGERWRRTAGTPCGTLLADWAGNPLKIGVHEVSSEIPLTNPITLHLAMPIGVSDKPSAARTWRQEQINAGAAEAA